LHSASFEPWKSQRQLIALMLLEKLSLWYSNAALGFLLNPEVQGLEDD
jgi:hypothetical protein